MSRRKKIAVLWAAAVLTAVGVFLLRPVPQDLAYHRFADTREGLGVPNFWNVMGNVFFLLVGIWGWFELSRRRVWTGGRFIYGVLFGAIFLTGLGSAYYHWRPDNDRLIWDRIPMTVVFMSLLAAVVGEWVDRKGAVWLMAPLVAVGVFSVLWWHHTEVLGRGDLRLYGWVQFFPALAIVLILVMFGEKGKRTGVRSLVWVVVWYAAAKVLEYFDKGIFSLTGMVSGHALKHVAAAVSTAYLVEMFRERHPVAGHQGETVGSVGEAKANDRRARWSRNRLLFVMGGGYALVALVLCICLVGGVWWVNVGRETTKAILSTMMGVSGSIIGFLVIYLTLALESMKRYYGRHAIPEFRRDPFVWVLCVFFSYIILLCLLAFFLADTRSVWWLCLFNLGCLSFMVGMGMVVPFGIVILNRTDASSRIRQLINSVGVADFRDPPTQRHPFMGTMFWTITENSDNPVDRLSGVLFHNISEGNGRVVADILIQFYERVNVIIMEEKGRGVGKVILRYFDVMLMAFDHAKVRNDEVTIKVILGGMTSGSDLIASWKMGPDIVDRAFEVARTIVQYLIEHENESLTEEAFWTYYHMVRPQIQKNLPIEGETWEADEDLGMRVIQSDQAWMNSRKFDAVDGAVSFRFKELIDRSFGCTNQYIAENAVKMSGVFVEMLIFEDGVTPFEKRQIGGTLAYQASELTKKFVKRSPFRTHGYLDMYVGSANMMTALKEDSGFSQEVFDYFVEIANFLINEEFLVKSDLDKIGGLGRLIVAYGYEFSDVMGKMRPMLEINRLARANIMRWIKEGHLNLDEKEVKEMASMAQNDLKSWLTMYKERGKYNPALEALIISFQV